MINKYAQISAFVVLLAGTFTFGLLGKPTEMGLCILAAAIALAFSNIEKIKHFKGAGFEAVMLERVEAMIAKEAEPPHETEQSLFTVKAFGLDDSTHSVVKALGNSKYTWRTVDGIAKESGLSAVLVKKSLNWLALNNLVIQAGTGNGINLGLSEEGRNLFNSITASESAA